jgi:hypothetical protein
LITLGGGGGGGFFFFKKKIFLMFLKKIYIGVYFFRKKHFMKAFQKHMTCPFFWSPLDSGGVSDDDCKNSSLK